MSNRRDFIKKAGLLAGLTGASSAIPNSILKAMQINAEPGTSFYDAEHVVFLMQENRSFDHMFGMLKGVRGFNDANVHTQPDGNKVWLQKDGQGNTYAPFHVDINKTKITWQGGLPHSWNDQLAARNGGKFDQWVPAKTPMALAHYDRSDIPFYYALADAFTVCDQHFCASLTGTTPNRLFFFTGTVRGEASKDKTAVVNNSQAESRDNVFVDWPTFQELLEDNNVDWRVYQNEIWTANLPAPKDDWLGNYGDNPLEYISRHNVKLSAYFRKNGDQSVKPPLTAEAVTEKYNKLTQRDKNLIDKAFTTNINHPDYLELEPFIFTDDKGQKETLNIPKGDIFYQFRKDVDEGKLPTVSWLVAPQRFSDHTSSPLYGTWYVSEALDILTKNPEVWKKTVFVFTYDENDGYFDHIPPFAVPNPNDPNSGKVSAGIDYTTDFEPKKGSTIGLGYRVPLVIASPWSKGGYVNSQVFDHTSSLMFLEKLLSKKLNKKVVSKNISDWRRAICGDLTSVFRPYRENDNTKLEALKLDKVITDIGNSKNKPAQTGPKALNKTEIQNINQNNKPATFAVFPNQEKGQKGASALPYHLGVQAGLSKDKNYVVINFQAEKTLFGDAFETVGAPFIMSTPRKYKNIPGKVWNYTVKAGDLLTERIALSDFDEEQYDFRVSGPNGFYRRFKGSKAGDLIDITVMPEQAGLLAKKLSGHLQIQLANASAQKITLKLVDNAYKTETKVISLQPNAIVKHIFNLAKSGGWYDISVYAVGNEQFEYCFAGKVETGTASKTDPRMAE